MSFVYGILVLQQRLAIRLVLKVLSKMKQNPSSKLCVPGGQEIVFFLFLSSGFCMFSEYSIHRIYLLYSAQHRDLIFFRYSHQKVTVLLRCHLPSRQCCKCLYEQSLGAQLRLCFFVCLHSSSVA